MASLTLTIKTPSADVSEYAAAGTPNRCLINAARLLKAIASGSVETSQVTVQRSSSNPVAASATITLASVSAADTVTIGKTVMTASATPSGESQWSQAGTDTVDAAGLVTKINAHSVLSKLVVATSVGAVVTVTSLVKGEVANHIALTSSNGTRLAVTGSGYLAGATGGNDSTLTVYRG